MKLAKIKLFFGIMSAEKHWRLNRGGYERWMRSVSGRGERESENVGESEAQGRARGQV